MSHKSKHIMSAPHESQLRKRKKRKDKQKEGWKAEEESGSRSVVSSSLRPHGLWLGRLLCSWNSPGKNTGVGCHALLQGIFPIWGWNQGLLPCRWILNHLSYKGSPQTEKRDKGERRNFWTEEPALPSFHILGASLVLVVLILNPQGPCYY